MGARPRTNLRGDGDDRTVSKSGRESR